MTATLRLALITPATTAALREARFEADVPLDAAGERAARAAAAGLPRADRAVCGPSRRCRETAAALGLRVSGAPTAAALADWDLGRWRGRTLAEVSGAEPDAVGQWLGDPAAAPHGGESLTALLARVGAWLDGLTPGGGALLAVVDPAVARALLTHALDLPPALFWRLDTAPLTLTELSARSGRWNLRCGTRLPAAGERPGTAGGEG
ncbi:histidine phosphatase family protein [Streptomyces yaizuensis]|uniref:Histidine phosphatase family protein n=1 Tax=Streptomyces yaizuensis TaxID=2989713 RepID=A0ABQ5P5J2_9ACTN|nr:histidine phosphatase family protein [Streptomyces sp. YSPA8]GLF97856.1 histidine phosphatase family protein [Streptomyces sp. YSPA8]